MEACDREVTQLEHASQEQVSDGIRVGVVWQRLWESTMTQHLLLSPERLAK